MELEQGAEGVTRVTPGDTRGSWLGWRGYRGALPGLLANLHTCNACYESR